MTIFAESRRTDDVFLQQCPLKIESKWKDGEVNKSKSQKIFIYTQYSNFTLNY